MNSEESLQTQMHLEDHEFRKVLYEKLKEKLFIIDFSVFDKSSDKLRKAELENYENFRKCIEPLSYNQENEFMECQTEFKKKDITSFVKETVKNSKNNLYQCLNNSYKTKNGVIADATAIDMIL